MHIHYAQEKRGADKQIKGGYRYGDKMRQEQDAQVIVGDLQ